MYTIAASGHGSHFRFDGLDPNSPPPGPHLELEEAVTKARGLESYGDTIGLSCLVIHAETLEIAWPEARAGQVFVPEFGTAHRPGSAGALTGLG